MNSFAPWIIYSDMDGTLIGEEGFIPERNRQAIAHFVANGGRFSVATGRNVPVARHHLEGLPINLPMILSNGSAAFDFATEQYVFETFLEASLARAVIELSKEIYPESLIELFGEGPVRMLGNPENDPYLLKEQAAYTLTDLSDPADDAFKLIVMGDTPRLQDLHRQLENAFPGVLSMVFSCPVYLEIMPAGIHKGRALERLCGQYDWDRQHIAAAGDFYNDLEMLQFAGLPAAPANAQPELHQIAKLRLCHCSDGAIAHLIEHLDGLCN